jgi:large subunit ribosomal protein L25
MEAIVLNGNTRSDTGKGACRRIRQGGHVPAVVYGHGVSDSISITLNERALVKALENPKGQNALINLEIADGDAHTVLVRQLQRDPVSRRILHVDLVSHDLNVAISATIPVTLTGRSEGVALGGYLHKPHRDIKVISSPDKVPVEVVVDVTALGVGDFIQVSQLGLPDGVQAIYDTDYIVVKVGEPRGKKESVEDEEAEE